MKEMILSVNPHIHDNSSTRSVMREVIIALIPAIIAALYFFRIKAFVVISSCVISCVVFEYLYQKTCKKNITVKDLSAVVTGILLALIMPPALPVWVCILASAVAIILTKQIFGGIGCNIFNPALLGRAFLMAAFPTMLTSWNNPITLDVVTTATPLGLHKFTQVLTGYEPLFFGNVSGSIGETSALALLIGAAYLLIKKIINIRIPFAYIATVFIISSITNKIDPEIYAPALFNLLAGGLMLGAFFMATDYVTTPITKKGQWVFGIGCGIVTMIIRLWGGLPEGVMYSILFMNGFTPLINRVTMPKRYGTGDRE
ncbi:MAG: RnfABCDGE type electron transport complex subunit D [Candidatus Omnitrophica bacterium]|nr:RnfABCDGE type electron transport complex subunit D [Candidatus Omnitrophota bacterium]